MKKLFLILVVSLSILNLQAQTRYCDEIFENITVEEDVVYGSNMNFMTYFAFDLTTIQELKMDIYQPANDTLTQRPLVIQLHSGSLLPEMINSQCIGEKQDSAMVNVARKLAKRGFVVANITYRLGWNPIAPEASTRRQTLLQALYRSTQDIHTAIRFFKKNVAETNNIYRIDPNKIAVFGQGTGAYTVYMFASLDTEEEIETIELDTLSISDIETYGWIDGTGYPDTEQNNFFIEDNPESVFLGDTMFTNIPNHVGYDSDIQLAFVAGGGSINLDWVSADSPPLAATQVLDDPSTPFLDDLGYIFFEPTLQTYGAGLSVLRWNQIGANDILLERVFDDPYSLKGLEVTNNIEDFEEMPHVLPLQTLVPHSAPWDWEDNPPEEIEDCNLYAGGASAALTYIDTLVNYFVPRAIVALDLPEAEKFELVQDTTMDNPNTFSPHLQLNPIQVYPNPAHQTITITLEENVINAINIYDIQGKFILSQKAINARSYNLKLADLNTGIYTLKIETDHQVYTEKIIIE